MKKKWNMGLDRSTQTVAVNKFLGQSTQTVEAYDVHLPILVLILCILSFLWRPSIEFPDLPRCHDVLHPRSLVCPFLVPHVEIAQDVAKEGLLSDHTTNAFLSMEKVL